SRTIRRVHQTERAAVLFYILSTELAEIDELRGREVELEAHGNGLDARQRELHLLRIALVGDNLGNFAAWKPFAPTVKIGNDTEELFFRSVNLKNRFGHPFLLSLVDGGQLVLLSQEPDPQIIVGLNDFQKLAPAATLHFGRVGVHAAFQGGDERF